VALAIALSACGGREDSAGASGADSADTEWVEIEGLEFPAGMEEADPEILEAYVFAAKHPEVLRYMPCYCGCENPRFAHENNYDCFVDGIDHSRDVPRVSPDAMGFS
jgi:hypothetical protein